jgi:cytochrome c oxidase subunit 3
VASPAAADQPFTDRVQQRSAAEFGIWVFLATELLFFGALFIGYAVYRFLYPVAFAVGSRATEVSLGTLNTALLLTSSCTIALAAKSIEADGRRAARLLTLATIGLGVLFMAVKGYEYYLDVVKGLVPGTGFALDPAQAQIFFSFYWVMTGIHALHVTVGLGVLAVLDYLLRTGRQLGATPEVIALYWHLVDVIWIFLYPLLYLVGRAA